MENILSILIWLPVVGMVAIAFIPREKEELIRITAAVTTGIQFLFTLFLWGDFDSKNGSMQFREWAEWIPSFNIAYHLGVDGLSLPMVILTGMLFFIGVFVSWNIKKAVKGYFALFLMLNTGVMGCFSVPRFLSLLHFLGSNAFANVFLNWNVGWSSEGICCYKILFIYTIWFGFNVSRYSRSLLLLWKNI